MWTPGPFESRPSRAMYYLTDVDPKWDAERKLEHLRDFNLPTLWAISIHEVYPGHFLHYQHLRKVDSKVRRSTMFAPASYIEGWAHYCEQMMIEAGFGHGDQHDQARPAGRSRSSASPASSSASACTPKTGRSSRACGSSATKRSSRKPNARREAERGTFDPTYLVYSAGKMMLLKLRRDWYEEQGGKPSLRDVPRRAAVARARRRSGRCDA